MAITLRAAGVWPRGLALAVAAVIAILGSAEAQAAGGCHSATSAPRSRAASSAAPDYYRNSKWCGGALRYLDDTACAKAFPSSFSRDWASPLWTSTVLPAADGWAVDTGRFDDVRVNTSALTDLVGRDTNACVILIRRTPPPNKAVYYRYLCGAPADTTDGHQPWSSTKMYATANAGGHIRTVCPGRGLPSSTTGRHGVTPLGDLATVIVSYDATQGYTSNGLSYYMHGLGGRQRLQSQLRAWFPTQAPNISLGGNYGELAPADLGFVLDNTCTIVNDTAHIPLNALSMVVHADLLRRIMCHGDLPPGQEFPDLAMDDVHTIWYGAPEAMLFPGLQWGGMSTDPGIFLQTGLPMDEVEQRSQGQWRIFSKLGAGWSDDNGVGEIVTAAYASLPVLNKDGAAVPDAGVEFILVGRASIKDDQTLVQADAALQQTVANIAKAIYTGQI